MHAIYEDCCQSLLSLPSKFEKIDKLISEGIKRNSLSHLIVEAKLGDIPMTLTRKTGLLPRLHFLRRVPGVDHSKGSAAPLH